MKIRRGKRPPDDPFVHEVGCRTPDAQPEWYRESPDEWVRVCSCGQQRAQVVGADGVDPDSEQARPAARAHQHAPGCAGQSVPQVVRIEHREGGGWRSDCGLCATQSYYFWTADFGGERARGVEVVSDGLFLRRYPLATPIVGDEEPKRAAEPAPAEPAPMIMSGRRHR